MTDLVLLPGLDGTGALFAPLIAHLPSQLRPIVVSYPPDQPLGYDQLLPRVLDALPATTPFTLLGESFSGPLALMAAARLPVGLRAVILCASFVRNPLPPGTALLRRCVRGVCFRFAPEFLRTWALLGKHATPELHQLTARAIAAVPPHVLAHRVRAVVGVDVRSALEVCPVPILYLRGTADRVVGRQNWLHVRRVSPSAQLSELPAPHFLLQTQPAAAAAAITDFLATRSGIATRSNR